MQKISYELTKCRDESLFTLKASFRGKEIYLHSPYNPVIEARRIVEAEKISAGFSVMILGFGLGYTAREVLDRIGPQGRLVVVQWDSYITEIALKQSFARDVLNDPRVTLIQGDTESKIISGLSSIDNIDAFHVIVHNPLLGVIPETMPKLKGLLQDFQINRNSIGFFKRQLELNIKYFMANLDKFKPAHRLYSRFEGKPLAIISAGPSLNEAIPHLSCLKDRVIFLSVGTAVKPLIKAGVEPDIVIVTDPQELVWNQLNEIDLDVPLIVLPTVAMRVMEGWRGDILVAFQQGVQEIRETASQWSAPLIETGGSVATAALDIAIRMGCNPIIFVGQDLAYTGGLTHSTGVDNRNLTAPKTEEFTESVNGTLIPTTRKFLLYKRWIEQRLRRECDRTFINTSPVGARIVGTHKIGINEIAARYDGGQNYDFKKIIQKIIQ